MKKLNQQSLAKWMIAAILLTSLPFAALSQKSRIREKVPPPEILELMLSGVDDEIIEFEMGRKKRKLKRYLLYKENHITRGGGSSSEEPPLPPKLTVEQLREYPMVMVSGGTFMMGCNPQVSDCYEDEIPATQKSVSDFYIGKYEVTGRVWRSVMDEDTDSRTYAPCDECPIVMVSWDEVQTFITRLNAMTGKTFRLPTEAEWEFAALGGNESKGYRYAGSDVLDEVVWHEGNTGMEVQPTGTKKPNELGLHDMSGNVWEWCADLYKPYGVQSQDPAPGSKDTQYVLRGGSTEDIGKVCRVKTRYPQTPDFKFDNVGFRLAASP